MEALIIAAGEGSRLSNVFSPKPLIPIFGLRLIERIIMVGKRAGIRDFKIVVGYKSTKIKQTIGNGRKYGVNITYIENPEWKKGNGVSVLKAKDHFHGKFLLLMSDHLCDEVMIKKLLSTDIGFNRCKLCIDNNLTGEHFSIDDVTKIYYEADKVKYIGKSLDNFNAIDTGVFLCTPAIFEALEKSIKQGEYSLSAGNQILAEQGKLETVDVTGCFWIDIDNEEALQKAQDLLIKQLFKPTDGLISKVINRKISTRISTYLARYNISPNLITLASFIMSVLSAIFFFFGGYVNILSGGIMAQFSSILDGCDGEVARLKFRFCVFGEWLDRVLDRYADGLIILGMTHALWLSSGDEFVWLLGFLALIGTYMNSYTARIYDDLLKKKFVNKNSFRIGRDLRLFIIFLGSLFNEILVALIIVFVITNIESIRRIFILRNVHRIRSTY
ncbi:MAG: hypothetical protein B6D58_04010 [candidate division Zixibacteria bacterium 4484_95]|nr:MAG: hypothetical protein B6D58_04010 [candidate division Zixibacteria bacterium 4484_95]